MKNQLQLLEYLIKFVDYPLHQHFDLLGATHLFFCFRWLLVLFKREFGFEEIKRIWETIWSCPLTKHFHIFVALSILNKHRQEIINNCRAFDECLKFINDLSGKIDVEDILSRAEVLFHIFEEMMMFEDPSSIKEEDKLYQFVNSPDSINMVDVYEDADDHKELRTKLLILLQ